MKRINHVRQGISIATTTHMTATTTMTTKTLKPTTTTTMTMATARLTMVVSTPVHEHSQLPTGTYAHLDTSSLQEGRDAATQHSLFDEQRPCVSLRHVPIPILNQVHIFAKLQELEQLDHQTWWHVPSWRLGGATDHHRVEGFEMLWLPLLSLSPWETWNLTSTSLGPNNLGLQPGPAYGNVPHSFLTLLPTSIA